MDVIAAGVILIALILAFLAIAWVFADEPDEPAPPEK